MFGSPIEVAAVAAFLVASVQIFSAMVGIYAAVSTLHWMVRALMVIVLFSPLLLVAAEELFLLLVVQTWSVALAVDGLRRCGVGPAMDSNAISVRQFSIGAFAFVTGVIACGVAVWRYLPDLNLNGWISLATWGWMAVGSATSAWCLINLKWRWHWRSLLAFGTIAMAATLPAMLDWLLLSFSEDVVGWPPEFMGWGTLGITVSRPLVTWYAITLVAILYLSLCVLLLVFQLSSLKVARAARFAKITVLVFAFLAVSFPGWVTFRLLTRPVASQMELSENSFGEIVDLGNEINSLPADSSELDAKLQSLRVLLEKPLAVPLTFTFDDISMVDIASLRTTSRAVVTHGETQFASGHFDNASQTLLLAVEHGIEVRRGGLLLHMLVGVAITGSSTPALFRCSEKCSRKERTRVVAALLRLIQSREPPESFVERDRLWSIHQGWQPHVHYLLNDIAGVKIGVVPMCVQAMNRELAELQLLVTEFAIANYKEDHGWPPGELELLTPEYLSVQFTDPFSPVGDRFKYRVTGDDHFLYSIGSNQIDDGGTPPTSAGDFAQSDVLFERVSD